MMSAEGARVTRKSSGFMKRTIGFLPAQLAWLDARADSKGQTGAAAVVRELIDDAMRSERETGQRAS